MKSATPPPFLFLSRRTTLKPGMSTSPLVTVESNHVSEAAKTAALVRDRKIRNSGNLGKRERTLAWIKCRPFEDKMRGMGHERNDEEVEEVEAAGEEWKTALASSPVTPLSSTKGREEKLQRSQTNANSLPSRTHSLYLAREIEREHRICVHLRQESHSTALLALVTPFAQTTHG